MVDRPTAMPFNHHHGSVRRYEKTREQRECLECGHERRVTVRRTHYADGFVAQNWKRLCAVCELRGRAQVHEQAARRFHARANKLEADRRLRALSEKQIAARDSARETRTCSEGGQCSFTPDLEYDSTGQTINCEKCGEAQ